MKYLHYITLLLALGLLLPVSALARSKDQGNMQIDEPAWVGNTQLKPGTYKVDWTGTGSAVTVHVMNGKTTVATTTATLRTNDQNATEDAVVLGPANNNSGKKVVEIDFGKDKEALLLNTGNQLPTGGE